VLAGHWMRTLPTRRAHSARIRSKSELVVNKNVLPLGGVQSARTGIYEDARNQRVVHPHTPTLHKPPPTRACAGLAASRSTRTTANAAAILGAVLVAKGTTILIGETQLKFSFQRRFNSSQPLNTRHGVDWSAGVGDGVPRRPCSPPSAARGGTPPHPRIYACN
jgi:hypothetical protein